MNKIQDAARVLLLVWFVVVGLFILVPSFYLLQKVKEQGTGAAQTSPQPPAPPELPAFDKSLDKEVQQKQIQSRVDAYQHQVTAYGQLVGSYKTQLDAQGKSLQLAVYQAVVKETLVSLITGLLTALISYVFVKEGAAVAKQYIEAKQADRRG